MPGTSRRQVFEEVSDSCRDLDHRPIHEWASEHVILPAAYAVQGPFHADKSRYLIEPFMAMADDKVREVTIQKGVQTGGSLIGDIVVCHTILERPQNIFWNFPQEDQASHYADRRAGPLLNACPRIAERMQMVRQDNRHKIKRCELLFPAMWLAIQGANLRNLQTHSVPMIINEEIWEWADGLWEQAKARTSYFSWRSKILNISQAGAQGSPIDLRYQAGTMEEWTVPCPQCRTYQPMQWSVRLPNDEKGQAQWAGMVWDTNEITRPNKVWHLERVRPTVRYVCPHCRAEWKDDPSLRRWLNDLGKYSVTNHNAPASHRSFHWSSLACDQVRWADVVVEYLQAKDQERLGNITATREWHQKRMAYSYDPGAHAVYDLVPTVAAALDGGKYWGKQDFLFMLVDVQRDSFWVTVDAWSSSGENCIVWAGQLTAWEDVAAKQKEYGVGDRCVFVDCGFQLHNVAVQCSTRGHVEQRPDGDEWVCWTMIKGDSRDTFVHVAMTGPEKGRRVRLPYSWPPTFVDPCLGLQSGDPLLAELRGRHCPMIQMAKGTIDTIAGERRDMLQRGETSFVADGPWREEFSKQLQGEQLETYRSPMGHVQTRWKRVGPNHLLDCYRMGILAACIAGVIGARRDGVAG